MRILVVSATEWDNRNAFGNTFSNWLEGMTDIEVASLYRRDAMPNNNVCTQYYKITFSSLIRGFFLRKEIGEAFDVSLDDMNRNCDLKAEESYESKIKAFAQARVKSELIKYLYKPEGFLFHHTKWNNEKFKKFITDFSPQIFFSSIGGFEPFNMIVKSVRELCPDCKFVHYIGDDVYGSAVSEKARLNIASLIKSADKVYGASQKMCDEYSKLFDREMTPLYKGCMCEPIQEKNNTPIRITYAGNMLYSREVSLLALAKAIKSHNDRSENQFELHIYTPSPMTDALRENFEQTGVVTLHGPKPYSEIKEILSKSDIVLHVESFEEEQIKVVRLSYSTKIIDCLQSGAAIMGIGPENVASIEYMSSIPGSITVTDLEKIEAALDGISKEDLKGREGKIREFALKNHDLATVQARLRKDFESVLEEKQS